MQLTYSRNLEVTRPQPSGPRAPAARTAQTGEGRRRASAVRPCQARSRSQSGAAAARVAASACPGASRLRVSPGSVSRSYSSCSPPSSTVSFQRPRADRALLHRHRPQGGLGGGAAVVRRRAVAADRLAARRAGPLHHHLAPGEPVRRRPRGAGAAPEQGPQRGALRARRRREAQQVEHRRHDVDLAHGGGHPPRRQPGRPDQQGHPRRAVEGHRLGQQAVLAHHVSVVA